jgi:peptidoglycan/xylan/chitin deacetylase (PgdA/CDA1 family)
MVKSLADRGFDMGGHTVNHPILKELSPDDAVSEIVGCSQWLETVTGTKPTSFAYPNGIPERDFDRTHEDMLSEGGFELAVSTEWSIATKKDRNFRIPRIGPWWRQGRSLESGLIRSYLKTYL